ncbi:MAG TPA: helix-turn-helix transcriptional regulator [Roseiarcus sp.]|nr:helix-turn-helix transcriptional regulator [Roseiarcus sp.]
MPASPGPLVRAWRERRRLSQLALACEAEISQRHLSFIESGRATPSRNMLLRLAERLEAPLRDRNALLLSAGYAPLYPDRGLDDPALGPARAAIERVLAAHEPYPALAIDRRWNLVLANPAAARLMAPIDPVLARPPVNVIRASLHPQGLSSRIVNLAAWRAHLMERLRRQAALTGDREIEALLVEVSAYPGPNAAPAADPADDIAVPLRLRTHAGLLSMFSTVTVFGTPVEVTLAELSIESFYPADPETARLLRETAG